MEHEPKPKRAYIKKAKVDESTITEVSEPKPKRTYTKKVKVIEETIQVLDSVVEEIPAIIEKKPKTIYIKKSKIVQENNNIESINTQIDIIQKDLDNLKIEDNNVNNNNVNNNNVNNDNVNNDNVNNDDVNNDDNQPEVIQNQENKRKIRDDNIEYEYKKPSLYTYDIDIDLILYIYDRVYDGTRLNKKSVLQISSCICTHIIDLNQYIVKEFYIKSNNTDIKVCYLGKNFNNNGKYDFENKLYIDNKTHKNVYEELIALYDKNKKDVIYFKKYIIEVLFYQIYTQIYN